MPVIQSGSLVKNQFQLSQQTTQLTSFWHHRIRKLNCLTLNITAEILHDCSMLSQKGGLMHDAFGRVLEQVSPKAYKALWMPDFDSDRFSQFSSTPPPKAFALNPPRETKSRYNKGDQIQFSLALFGKASVYAKEALSALYKIGENGLGSQIARYKIIGCDTQDQSQKGQHNEQLESSHLVARFESPTYFKQSGKQFFHAPDFEYLLSRIIYRVNWISVLNDQNTLISQLEREEILKKTQCVEIVSDQSHQAKWSRYSISRQKWMRFDGIAGHVVYRNVSQDLMPLLHLAEVANIGGKTSFGMGEVSFSPLLKANHKEAIHG